VTLKQFGDVVIITDKVAGPLRGPGPEGGDGGESGKQAAATIEQITYGVVKAGTSVFYANGASRAAVNTAISLNKQRAVTRYLKRQKAQKFTKILAGSVNYATKPIEASYIGITHTDLEPDIRNMAASPRSPNTASASRFPSTSSGRSRTCATSRRRTWRRSRTRAVRRVARCSRRPAPAPTSIRC
jgi:N4-gp56 family major capsid protein